MKKALTSILFNITKDFKTLINQELPRLEGQVNALKQYEEYTSRIISDLNSQMDELRTKKAHLVDKCLN